MLSSVEGTSIEKLNSSNNGGNQKHENDSELFCAGDIQSQVLPNPHKSNCNVISVSPSAPELSQEQSLMNRLLFDEGGLPSAPSFSEVCSRPPAVSHECDEGSTCFNHAKNTDTRNVRTSSSQHENIVPTENGNSDVISKKGDDGFQMVQSK